ncbi:MAG: T9SS type A sorting domain-containing protein [Calditrichaeota bacterium]|nr:T9SS type A sorting domain-containing protein [Calditrichota bacterium]MBT7618419.1 T9SS type A sorting domain-containing protein [Calditrichota bacterium]
MRTICFIFTVLISVFLTYGSATAEVHNVPDDFDTIQAAIDAARDGDEIRVSAGRYEEILTIANLDVDIIGNPEDPSTVVIDGAQGGVVITYSGDVRNSTVLDGFTITGGEDNARSGGGITCSSTSPSLRNLVITENSGARGGGILVEDGNPAIRDVWITSNISAGYGGGITLMGAASPVMNNLVITNNRSVNRGGGLASFSRGRPELHESEISNNTSDNNGGGLFSQGNMRLVDVTIDSNSCEGEGGGLYANGNIAVSRVIISANQSGGNGGGIYIDGPRPGFERMLIAGNSTQSLGGGIFISGTPNNVSVPTFYHVTFVGNTAEQDGGAFYCHDGTNPVIRDCILWGNQPQEISFNEAEDASSITMTYSNVEGGEDAIESNNNGEVTWGTGAIDEDPLFANPDEGDYHLTWDNFPENDESKSPCINTGHPNIDPDPDGTRADMGMYYFHHNYPDISVNTDLIDFETLEVGDSRTLPVIIGNTGEEELNVTLTINQEDSPFSIMRENVNFTVQPDEEEVTAISFAPQERGEYAVALRVASNDPDDPIVIVGLRGIGANRPPQPDEEQSFTISEDVAWTFLVDLSEMFTDPDGDDLVFSFVDRQYLTFEIRESSMLYVHPQLDYWTDPVDCIVLCDDQFGGVAENIIHLTIDPLNDLPDPFILQTPSDESMLEEASVVFIWQLALQNRWETDEITYKLFLNYADDGWEHQIEGLRINRSPRIPILNILDSLSRRPEDIPSELIWWVEAHDDSGFVECRERFILNIPPASGVIDDPEIPTTFSMFQNYPNPFNAETNISFALPLSGKVTVTAYDLTGRPVATIANEYRQVGLHEINWNAEGLQAGVYMIEVVSGYNRGISKVILLK